MKVRRPEFKRARHKRWRDRRRHSTNRYLRDSWRFLMERLNRSMNAMIYGLTEGTSSVSEPTTTLATAQAVEPVNYDGSARGAL